VPVIETTGTIVTGLVIVPAPARKQTIFSTALAVRLPVPDSSTPEDVTILPVPVIVLDESIAA
jgi:hypothetical protein